MKIETPSRIIAFALGALCFYLWDQIYEEIPIDKVNLREISFEEDDEFAHGIPLDEDFDMFVLQKFVDAGGVLTMDEVCHDYEQTKMEIFYGR